LPFKQQQRVVTQHNECLVYGSGRLVFTLVSSLDGPSASLQLTNSTQPKGYLGGSGETRKACRSESRHSEIILATQDDPELLMLSLTSCNLAGLNKESDNCRYSSWSSVGCSTSDMIAAMIICFSKTLYCSFLCLRQTLTAEEHREDG